MTTPVVLTIRDDDPVVRFVKNECYRVPGASTPLKDFREQFANWSTEREAPYRSLTDLKMVLKAMGCPVGRHNFHRVMIGNLSLVKGTKRGPRITQYAHRIRVPRGPVTQRSPEEKRLAQARRRITEMGRQGYRLAFIADHLDAKGYVDADGKPWNAGTVSRELRRPR